MKKEVKTWSSSMRLEMDVKDLKCNADKRFNFGGTPWISPRYLQPLTLSKLKKQHSSRHFGRTVKLFHDSSKCSTLANHVRIIGWKSSDGLHFGSPSIRTSEGTMELSSVFCFGNKQPEESVNNFGIMRMLLCRICFPCLHSRNFWSRVRFWNENGNSFMEVPTQRMSVIFSIFPKTMCNGVVECHIKHVEPL